MYIVAGSKDIVKEFSQRRRAVDNPVALISKQQPLVDNTYYAFVMHKQEEGTSSDSEEVPPTGSGVTSNPGSQEFPNKDFIIDEPGLASQQVANPFGPSNGASNKKKFKRGHKKGKSNGGSKKKKNLRKNIEEKLISQAEGAGQALILFEPVIEADNKQIFGEEELK